MWGNQQLVIREINQLTKGLCRGVQILELLSSSNQEGSSAGARETTDWIQTLLR